MVNEICITERNRLLVFIPRLVLHAVQNIGTTEAIFINVPTRPYNHANPDEYRVPSILRRSHTRSASARDGDPADRFRLEVTDLRRRKPANYRIGSSVTLSPSRGCGIGHIRHSGR